MKKSETGEDLFRSKYNEIRNKYTGYRPIYTDGSKTEDAVNVDKYSTETYNKNISIFSAEVRALKLALIQIQYTKENKHIIFSDSKSALEAIQDLWTQHPLVQNVLTLHTYLSKTKEIVFCWVPSHVGIKGNEAADRAAKAALTSPVTNCAVPALDWLPKVTQYVKDTRSKCWNEIQNNKLKEIVPDIKEHQQLQCDNRRDEVVLTRLRIGHSRFTHAYLMEGKPAPKCIGCDTNFTIKHILIDCVDFADTRKLFYNCQDLYTLFRTVVKEKILDFVREIGLYHKL